MRIIDQLLDGKGEGLAEVWIQLLQKAGHIDPIPLERHHWVETTKTLLEYIGALDRGEEVLEKEESRMAFQALATRFYHQGIPLIAFQSSIFLFRDAFLHQIHQMHVVDTKVLERRVQRVLERCIVTASSTWRHWTAAIPR